MSDSTQQVTTELSRELNLFHITMMGLGMMIGAGVFIGVGNVMHKAGPGGLMLTFALNGLVAIFTAMSYAELSSAIPRAGGHITSRASASAAEPAFSPAGWNGSHQAWPAASTPSFSPLTLSISSTSWDF